MGSWWVLFADGVMVPSVPGFAPQVQRVGDRDRLVMLCTSVREGLPGFLELTPAGESQLPELAQGLAIQVRIQDVAGMLRALGGRLPAGFGLADPAPSAAAPGPRTP